MDKQIDYLQKYIEPEKLNHALTRLKKGEPVQYIVGHVDFYGFKIKVNHNVLIPRFETEELIYKTVNYIKQYLSEEISILDVGTGSGCIAITLKKLLPKTQVSALDISRKALGIAKENAVFNEADITFYKSDMLNDISNKYDVIISNPPYIAHDEPIMDLVKNNEPHVALYASNNGLEFYIKIIKNVSKIITNKSILAFEIGENQGELIKKLVLETFPKSTVKIEKDMQNRERFVFVFIGE